MAHNLDEPDAGDPLRLKSGLQMAGVALRVVLEDLPGVGTALRLAFNELDAVRQGRLDKYVRSVASRVEKLEELVRRPNEAELLRRGGELSLDARTADKIEALAGAVAYGLTIGDSGMTLAHMTLDAIGSLEETQIRVLHTVATAPPDSLQLGGFTEQSVLQRMPEFDPRLLAPTLSLLQGKGLVAQLPADATFGKSPLYSVTSLGEAVIDLLTKAWQLQSSEPTKEKRLNV